MAIYLEDSPHSLRQLIGNADYINHAIPNAEEVAWAFLQLRKRNWLVEEGSLVDLSRVSRRIIANIVGRQGSVMDWYDRLDAWLLAHPVDP